MGNTATTRQLTRVVDGQEVPAAGRYDIDRSHSMIEFVGRHLVVTKVRGRFTDFEGHIVIGENLADSSVEFTAQAASITTNDERRDEHLRSEDFLAVGQYPTVEFRSTKVEQAKPGRWVLRGDLTVRG